MRFLLLWIAALGVAACSFDAELPLDAQLSCRGPTDCPDPLVCLLSEERCVSAESPCIAIREGLAVAEKDGNSCSAGSICVRGNCQSERCGDGLVSGEETCDGTPDCRTNCTRCGDGVLDPEEDCDNGPANGESAPGACPSTCQPVCGNGVIESGERCDDENDNPLDGCDRCAEVPLTWPAEAVVGSPQPGISVTTLRPLGVAVDVNGNLFVAHGGNPRVRKVDRAGNITTIAGIGSVGFSGDGGPATAARLNLPSGVAVDGLGNVFIADSFNNRIRKVAPDGIITTFAGSGPIEFSGNLTSEDSGDGGLATAANLVQPSAVAVDRLGNVFISEPQVHRVRKVDLDGRISTFAGNGVRSPQGGSGDGGPATIAELGYPIGIAVDNEGNLFIADSGNAIIRKVDLDGFITTVAGGGAGVGCDGGPATAAEFTRPDGVAVDESGRLFIADSWKHQICKVELDGTVTRIAGIPTEGGGFHFSGFSGDGGLATDAELFMPTSVAVDTIGTVFIADSQNHVVRKVATDGIITTIAGENNAGAAVDQEDPIPATTEPLSQPYGVAVDSQGNVLVADLNFQRIRKVTPDGNITTFAGSGRRGFGGDGGPAIAAQLADPFGIAIDDADNLFIADTWNYAIRKVTPDGIITTVAGSGVPGFQGDGGPATDAQLKEPAGVGIDALGNIFIADTGNSVIRKVTPGGVITTVAGNGTEGYSGDEGAATDAQLTKPAGVAVDHLGNLFIADAENNVVRKVDLGGVITTVAGTGTANFSGDNGPAAAAELHHPSAVAVDIEGNLFIADSWNFMIRKVTPDGVIRTVAGMPALNVFGGDGGPATSAQLFGPFGVALDNDGNIYIADTWNDRVRKVSVDGTITTIAGFIGPEGLGSASTTRVDTPVAFASSPFGNLIATGSAGVVVAWRESKLLRSIGRYPQSPPTGDWIFDGFSPVPTGEPGLAYYRDSTFGDVFGVAYDSLTGTIYFSESKRRVPDPNVWNDFSGDRIWAVSTQGAGIDPELPQSWTITAVVNVDGTPGYADGPADIARLREPSGLLFDDSTRTLYFTERGNHTVRALDLETMEVSTVANAGNRLGFSGDGSLAREALLFQPTAIARCPNGDFFIADTGNHRIRRIAGSVLALPGASETSPAAVTPAELSSSTITTVLGDGVASSSGEGGPAVRFSVNSPQGVACDLAGNVFASSTRTIRVLPSNATGIVDGKGPVYNVFGSQLRSDRFPESESTCLSFLAVTSPVDPAVATTRAAGHANELITGDGCSGIVTRLSRSEAP